MGKEKFKSSIKAKDIQSIYPLSPLQKEMLFRSIYASESGVYCKQVTSTFEENLNVLAFESAWQKVVDRHQYLHILLTWESCKEPLQVVLKPERRQLVVAWNDPDSECLSDKCIHQLFEDQIEKGTRYYSSGVWRPKNDLSAVKSISEPVGVSSAKLRS